MLGNQVRVVQFNKKPGPHLRLTAAWARAPRRPGSKVGNALSRVFFCIPAGGVNFSTIILTFGGTSRLGVALPPAGENTWMAQSSSNGVAAVAQQPTIF